MAQIRYRSPVAAGMRRGGDGPGRHSKGLWERGHDMDSISGRRGLLVRHLFHAAQADVDLRFWT